MKRLKLMTAIIAVSLLVVTGCKKDVKPDNRAAATELGVENNSVSKQSTQLSAATQA